MTLPKAMASQAELRRLWNEVLSLLVLKLTTGKPSGELLDTARRFMSQSGFTGPAHSPIVVKRLAKLHTAYVSSLQAAMDAGNPSASMLNEVRQYLLQTDTTLGRLGDSSNTSLDTLNIEIPFTTPH